MATLSENLRQEASDHIVKFTQIDAGLHDEQQDGELIWNDDNPPAVNYDKLGKRLTRAGDLFRRPEYGDGLIMLLEDGQAVNVTKGADLAPIIVDRVLVRILKEGKPKGGQIAAAHLNAMLRSKMFLDHFLPVDLITKTPLYLSDFQLAKPGYNDDDPGNRVLFTGERPNISESLDHITAFLDVMDFASNADRTNAVGGLLTTTLRNQWPGGKPIAVVTATKSHSGKDTVIMFMAGVGEQCSISYQATNWALERNFVGVTSP